MEHYEKFLDLWNDADPGIADVGDVGVSLDSTYTSSTPAVLRKSEGN